MSSAFVMPALSAKAENVSYSSEVSVALTVCGRLQLIMPPGKQSESVRPPIQNQYEIAFLFWERLTSRRFFEVTPSLPLEMKANFISNFIAVGGDNQDVLADKGGEYGPIYLAQHQSCNHRNGDWAERSVDTK
ncbi:hypothetical protein [Collinsella aerofaciens]|uniref:hypothetical protein n=1 Tax=Collinsella aerofaciens TaxID=74426 RepID=UPI001897250E|nr:hypothetical protein [Collinsella aerofaciens]MDB1863629.1 hypothetical protein [Collinsella aerofaciens]